MTDIDFGSFFVQLVTAGQRHHARRCCRRGCSRCSQHPDQLAELRADPSLIPGAVEEILRYGPTRCTTSAAPRPPTPSSRGVDDRGRRQGRDVSTRRPTATRTCSTTRSASTSTARPNPHLSFGIAEHFCLGVHLARLEGRVFFEELLATFPTIELTGEPVRVAVEPQQRLQAPARAPRRLPPADRLSDPSHFQMPGPQVHVVRFCPGICRWEERGRTGRLAGDGLSGWRGMLAGRRSS